MKVRCSSIETSISDCRSNAFQIISKIEAAYKAGIELIVFPELTITGYSCGDLFFNDSLLESSLSSIKEIAKYTLDKNIMVIAGLPLGVEDKIFNCAAVILDGQIKGIVPKTYIPNTNEYYEKRWFTSSFENNVETVNIDGYDVPFGQPLIFQIGQVRLGLEICEDMWAPISVSSMLSSLGANLIVNLSTSNETVTKYEIRKEILKSQSFLQKCIYIYCSGGFFESTTDVVYSEYKGAYSNGRKIVETQCEKEISFEISTKESIAFRRKNAAFSTKNQYLCIQYRKIIIDNYLKENVQTFNLEKEPFLAGMELNELCTRVVDLQKNGLWKKINYTKRDKLIIGVSGGLDSTVALLSCTRLFNEKNISLKNIIGISMPGPGTTKRTFENSIKLMEDLGITSVTIDIKDAVQKHLENISQPKDLFDITYEQTQSRERTKILMDYANKENGLVIGTGDMSEFALGWMSYSGDQISMYALNCGIPKSVIRHLAVWYQENASAKLSEILLNIVTTPISPELLPLNDNGIQKQSTEDIVGPYLVHDFFLYYFVGGNRSIRDIYKMASCTFTEYSKECIKKWLKLFCTRFFTRQFKRTCYSDGVQIFDIGLSPRGYWRMPSDVSNDQWLEEIEKL